MSETRRRRGSWIPSHPDIILYDNNIPFCELLPTLSPPAMITQRAGTGQIIPSRQLCLYSSPVAFYNIPILISRSISAGLCTCASPLNWLLYCMPHGRSVVGLLLAGVVVDGPPANVQQKARAHHKLSTVISSPIPYSTPLDQTNFPCLFPCPPVCSLCEYAGQPHYSHFLILLVSLPLSLQLWCSHCGMWWWWCRAP